jgi:hypothetical protein
MNKLQQAWWYLKQTGIETIGCQIIILGYLPNRTGLIVSVIVYALLHFILFKWQVVALCVPFGIILGWTYLSITHPTNVLVVMPIHFIVGAVAWKYIKKFLRNKPEMKTGKRRFYV